MTRRTARTAPTAITVIVGGAAASALLLGTGLLAGVGAEPAWAANCDRDWSVTLDDGSPVTTRTLFADERISPGASLDGSFRVTTGRDIRGPLELRAVRTGPTTDAALEADTVITLSGASRSVTRSLAELLDDDGTARVIDALTPGAHDIGITVQLPFDSANTTQLGTIPFQLEVTVSDEHTLVGSDPEACASPPGGDGGAGGGSGGAGTGLASTGVEGGTGLALGSLLLGAGFAGVVAARRRRREQ
ncbi:hypothetical protein [Microterricola viridarii]|uniref:Gram-positive cocci surface proteins LPxTG domain-containing protein n=1 Tax=Microterricola viridarii TaxID=412690 RepID=A0A0Y0PIV7_9MICO|nr:hypothetical protein [Microterricola viridarii]AMB59787.1 hypothetical protein AWU67_13990 [Microterricola viridarii]